MVKNNVFHLAKSFKIEEMMKKLCTPAYLYFTLSMLIFIIIVLQNLIMGSMDSFCLGVYKCNVPHIGLVLLAQLFYIFLWTFIFQGLCKLSVNLSWFVLLLPFLLGAVLLGLLMIFQSY